MGIMSTMKDVEPEDISRIKEGILYKTKLLNLQK
jgi:hypothetical protein